MKNMKVSAKLITSFLIVSILAIIISGVGILELTTMANETKDNQRLITLPQEYMVKFAISYGHVRSATRDIGRSTTPEDNEKHRKTLTTNLDLVNQYMNEYYDVIKSNPKASKEESDAIKSICDSLVSYTDICDNKLIPAGMANDAETVYATISKDLAPPGAVIRDNIDFLTTYNSNHGEESSASITRELQTSLIVNIALLAVSLITVVILARYVSGLICKPLKPLYEFMQQAGSTGNIILRDEDQQNIANYAKVRDEVGQTIAAAAAFVSRVSQVSKALETIADGDLSAEIAPLSPHDTLGVSLQKMTDNLNDMFGNIGTSSAQVSAGAGQIADGAQALAQGATQQAASIQELSSTVSEISQRTKANAEMAERAAKLADTIKSGAEKGSRQMDEMMTAVRDISQSSYDISKVIKVIDDIAFQTNILALNAAVEAARAGQHGKGFAVVAEEVRNLASKSADAAKDTESLIASSMEKAELGVRIAEATSSSLSEIVSGINESSSLVSGIAESSDEASRAISQINNGIEQVAHVVQQNSATAQESAAASQEMSSQSAMLREWIAQFKTRGDAPSMPLSPAPRPLPSSSRTLRLADDDLDGFGKY